MAGGEGRHTAVQVRSDRARRVHCLEGCDTFWRAHGAFLNFALSLAPASAPACAGFDRLRCALCVQGSRTPRHDYVLRLRACAPLLADPIA